MINSNQNQNQDQNTTEEKENSNNLFDFPSFNFGSFEFVENFKNYTGTLKMPTITFDLPRRLRHLLSVPFIYSMAIPALILDIGLTIYNWTALPLYRIPPVRRQDYIVYDRKFMEYLNPFQKINCLYCSYVNGLFAYAVEIAARTERYWCPLKSAHKRKGAHNWYQDFAENPEEWQQKFKEYEAFKGICKDNEENFQ